MVRSLPGAVSVLSARAYKNCSKLTILARARDASASRLERGQYWRFLQVLYGRGLYSLEMPPTIAVKRNGGFDPDVFLATIGDGRKILVVPKKQAIFAQGDEADAVFYVQKGKVRLTVVSQIGKEATIAIVNEGNFFGEGSLAGQLLTNGLRRGND